MAGVEINYISINSLLVLLFALVFKYWIIILFNKLGDFPESTQVVLSLPHSLSSSLCHTLIKKIDRTQVYLSPVCIPLIIGVGIFIPRYIFALRLKRALT